MIYLLYGADREKSRGKLNGLVGELLKKKPDAAHLKITAEGFEPSQLDELIGASGLFGARIIVEMDHLFADASIAETMADRLEEFAESNNIFIFLEGELTKPVLKKFEKASEKVQEFSSDDQEAPATKRDFNIFSLTDAFGRRDRKQLWALYAKATMKGAAAEEIHGILFWQLKTMILGRSTSSAAEAGLKPFVYQKSLGFSKHFSDDELKTISSRLVSLYHDARRGIVDFDVALEKFILEV